MCLDYVKTMHYQHRLVETTPGVQSFHFRGRGFPPVDTCPIWCSFKYCQWYTSPRAEMRILSKISTFHIIISQVNNKKTYKVRATLKKHQRSQFRSNHHFTALCIISNYFTFRYPAISLLHLRPCRRELNLEIINSKSSSIVIGNSQ